MAAAANEAVARAGGRRAGSATPALEVGDLSVRFGGIQAVSDVSLRSRPAEIVGVIGPNGAGKTTLFDLISGFTRAERGRVLLGGTDLTSTGPTDGPGSGWAAPSRTPGSSPPSPSRRPSRWPWTGGSQVKDPLNPALHLPAWFDSERMVADRVEPSSSSCCSLEAYRSKFVRELSTGIAAGGRPGLRRRPPPEVVLLDEPSSGIAQRESEALAPAAAPPPGRARRSLVVIEHDMPLVTRSPIGWSPSTRAA